MPTTQAVKSGLFTSIPYLIGAAVMILTNWIGDRIWTRLAAHCRGGAPAAVRDRNGDPIPGLVDSLTLVIILTIFPASFCNTAAATSPALCNDLLRSRADSGRAFAFMVLGGNTFGLLAPIVTGYIVSATGSFANAFMLARALLADQSCRSP